eukprot:582895-Rhodomonas_salina.5
MCVPGGAGRKRRRKGGCDLFCIAVSSRLSFLPLPPPIDTRARTDTAVSWKRKLLFQDRVSHSIAACCTADCEAHLRVERRLDLTPSACKLVDCSRRSRFGPELRQRPESVCDVGCGERVFDSHCPPAQRRHKLVAQPESVVVISHPPRQLRERAKDV